MINRDALIELIVFSRMRFHKQSIENYFDLRALGEFRCCEEGHDEQHMADPSEGEECRDRGHRQTIQQHSHSASCEKIENR